MMGATSNCGRSSPGRSSSTSYTALSPRKCRPPGSGAEGGDDGWGLGGAGRAMRRRPEMRRGGAGKAAAGMGLGSGSKTPIISAAAYWPALSDAGNGGGKVGDSG